MKRAVALVSIGTVLLVMSLSTVDADPKPQYVCTAHGIFSGVGSFAERFSGSGVCRTPEGAILDLALWSVDANCFGPWLKQSVAGAVPRPRPLWNMAGSLTDRAGGNTIYLDQLWSIGVPVLFPAVGPTLLIYSAASTYSSEVFTYFVHPVSLVGAGLEVHGLPQGPPGQKSLAANLVFSFREWAPGKAVVDAYDDQVGVGTCQRIFA